MSLSRERNSVTLKTKAARSSETPTPIYDLTQFNTQQTINGATPARKCTNQFMFAAALAKRFFVLKHLFL
jgi:hypothetical protein